MKKNYKNSRNVQLRKAISKHMYNICVFCPDYCHFDADFISKDCMFLPTVG